MSDITKLSLNELIQNIRNKKLSSTEITKSYIERSEKSKKLNTYVTENFSSALEAAKIFDEKPNIKKLFKIMINNKLLFIFS